VLLLDFVSSGCHNTEMDRIAWVLEYIQGKLAEVWIKEDFREIDKKLIKVN